MSGKLFRELYDRVKASGDTSAGQLNLIADILSQVSSHADAWTRRVDDAMRIPDMIHESSKEFREAAQSKGDMP